MKLLGLRLCEHDSNISYFDGTKLHYYKSERDYQIKHHGYDDLITWRDDIQRIFGVKPNEIDDIAIVIDPWQHNFPTDNEEFFPAIDYPLFKADCPVQRINHHYAHALSCFPVNNKIPDVEVVIDGFGEINNAWTVFKDNKVFERGYEKEHGSPGVEMFLAGKWLNIEYKKGSEYEIKADMVIKALGFDPEDLPYLFDTKELQVTKWGTVRTDFDTMETNLKGVFAAGDIVRGASLVVWAIKDGRDAAVAMKAYLENIESEKSKVA